MPATGAGPHEGRPSGSATRPARQLVTVSRDAGKTPTTRRAACADSQRRPRPRRLSHKGSCHHDHQLLLAGQDLPLQRQGLQRGPPRHHRCSQPGEDTSHDAAAPTRSRGQRAKCPSEPACSFPSWQVGHPYRPPPRRSSQGGAAPSAAMAVGTSGVTCPSVSMVIGMLRKQGRPRLGQIPAAGAGRGAEQLPHGWAASRPWPAGRCGSTNCRDRSPARSSQRLASGRSRQGEPETGSDAQQDRTDRG